MNSHDVFGPKHHWESWCNCIFQWHYSLCSLLWNWTTVTEPLSLVCIIISLFDGDLEVIFPHYNLCFLQFLPHAHRCSGHTAGMTFYSARLFRALQCSDAENISPLWAQILGNHTEFQRVAALLQDTLDFDTDVNASVFETNIRGRVTSLRGWISQSIISKYLDNFMHIKKYFCITVKYGNAHYCRAILNILHFLSILGKLVNLLIL